MKSIYRAKFSSINILLLLIFLSILSTNYTQTTLSGRLTDSETGEDLIGASIKIIDSKYGCVTDFNGKFKMSTNIPLPFSIKVSYIGYNEKILIVENTKPLILELSSKDMQLDAVEVISGISKKLKESPLSIEAMDINDIKQTSATDFYEGLSHMKGVDLTSASLGFKVINTRGFNSTSPVRSLQIIDGVDNASPGLNFALGNFLGASELDLMKVEIVSGASSAFYGPNAFNGVISMQTKDPFLFPGFSASVKTGERLLNEYAIRYAEVIKDKDGKERFAYKLNLNYMNADDWVADNSSTVADLETDETNPGGYDAVNRYGDENLNPRWNQMIYGLTGNVDTSALISYPGLRQWHRKGYWEKDLVDYNTENLKTSLGLYYLFNNEVQISTISNFSTGTTVYQGDNRFSLKDIKFFQNKIELKKDNDFFIRLYTTHEDAGNSYDAVLTAFQIQNAAADDQRYHELYKQWWEDRNLGGGIFEIVSQEMFPGINWTPYFDTQTQTPYPADRVGSMNAINQIPIDSLISWHQKASIYANSKNIDALDFFEVGTERFDSIFDKTVSTASVLDGGSKIVDKSALYHGHLEKIFDLNFAKVTIGSNFRFYTPKSNGSLFSDTAINHTEIITTGADTLGMTKIINREFGSYIGLEKQFLRDQLIVKASFRVDKNQNFNFIPTKTLSSIFNLNENNTVRTTFTSAIRNPTLLNQYQYYNVGRAILVGNINGYENLCTPESVFDKLFRGEDLQYFNLEAIKPEEVNCVEFGYRGILNNNFYLDVNYYYNWYTNFIGFINGVDATPDPIFSNKVYVQNVYRIATNSTELITTQGFSAGLNYYFDNKYSISGNYSWNKLNKQINDPIVPAYNTPENKFNIGFNGKEIDVSILKIGKINFNTNFKWVQGFIFEGSPQFTGKVPTYSLLDFQITKLFLKQNISIKIGASNILNNKILQVYGGPYIGRMSYISMVFDFNNKK
tara:strand:+ start:13048 stop:15948 length:2901 start_codon:yes stop_codon:yes gene_type:complete